MKPELDRGAAERRNGGGGEMGAGRLERSQRGQLEGGG